MSRLTDITPQRHTEGRHEFSEIALRCSFISLATAERRYSNTDVSSYRQSESFCIAFIFHRESQIRQPYIDESHSQNITHWVTFTHTDVEFLDYRHGIEYIEYASQPSFLHLYQIARPLRLIVISWPQIDFRIEPIIIFIDSIYSRQLRLAGNEYFRRDCATESAALRSFSFSRWPIELISLSELLDAIDTPRQIALSSPASSERASSILAFSTSLASQ